MRRTNSGWIFRFAVLLVTATVASTSRGQEPQDQAAPAAPQAVPEESQPAPQARVIAGDDGVVEITYEGMPQVEAGRFVLPALQAPTIATENVGNGRRPIGFDDRTEVPAFALPESGNERADVWNWTICSWAAANTFSNPRYFEDRMLERHGHQRLANHRFGKHLQPVASGARFFATVPMLPYLMTVRDPCDCEYTLGYYRAGSRTPGLLQRPPLDRRALIMESAVVAGVMVAFP